MKIGDLAKATGLAPSRIRFYEAEGLISAPPRGSNGYRIYSPDVLGVLQIIDNAQRVGFSLDEIRHFLPGGTQACDHQGLVESLGRRLAEIRRLILQLQENEARLLGIIEGVTQRPEGISCTDNQLRLMDLLDPPRRQRRGRAGRSSRRTK